MSSNIENKRHDYNVEVVLYRVISELINNTIKHALASKINILIFENDSLLNVTYADNRIVFDDKIISNLSKGMGYSNIHNVSQRNLTILSLSRVLTPIALYAESILSTKTYSFKESLFMLEVFLLLSV
jgi:two-component sensor histidine kinase